VVRLLVDHGVSVTVREVDLTANAAVCGAGNAPREAEVRAAGSGRSATAYSVDASVGRV
jgi:hypothetical protein